MSRFAPVVPLHIARKLKEWELLGDYHLLLAHDVLEHPLDYQEVYGHIAKTPEGCIILDNSVIELGKAMDIDRLVRAVEIIKPNWLVVPDEMGQMEATINSAETFTREYEKVMGRHDGPNLLVVVHGQSVDEHRICAQQVAQMPRVRALSAPRIATKTLGSRMEVVMNIRRYHPVHFLHLLGFSDNVLDDICCARIPGVQGIDSAVPIRAGIKGVYLVNDRPQPVIGPRGDFWNAPIDHEACIRVNVERYRKWIDTRYQYPGAY